MKTHGTLNGVILTTLVLGCLLPGLANPAAGADDVPTVHPVAILPFQERGSGVKGYGDKVGDILFASLVAEPELYLVERAEIEKLLKEHELNLTGMVAQGQATQLGQLTGAKILVTGSVIEVGKTLYLVAKIIGTETSRVLGQSVKGKTSDDLATLAEQLADKIATTITTRADQLVAKPLKREDRIKALADAIGYGKRPKVFIRVTERHVGQPTIDPAAETELTLCCKETGFEVIDPTEGSANQADVKITGEGFSEFAVRQGNLVSVKARLEVKAVDRYTGKVLAIDRQVTVEVDLTEQIAGKNALQEAALQIAQRLLPKVVHRWKHVRADK